MNKPYYFEARYSDAQKMISEAIAEGYVEGGEASIYDYVPPETDWSYGQYATLRGAKIAAVKASKLDLTGRADVLKCQYDEECGWSSELVARFECDEWLPQSEIDANNG